MVHSSQPTEANLADNMPVAGGVDRLRTDQESKTMDCRIDMKKIEIGIGTGNTRERKERDWGRLRMGNRRQGSGSTAERRRRWSVLAE